MRCKQATWIITMATNGKRVFSFCFRKRERKKLVNMKLIWSAIWPHQKFKLLGAFGICRLEYANSFSSSSQTKTYNTYIRTYCMHLSDLSQMPVKSLALLFFALFFYSKEKQILCIVCEQRAECVLLYFFSFVAARQLQLAKLLVWMETTLLSCLCAWLRLVFWDCGIGPPALWNRTKSQPMECERC